MNKKSNYKKAVVIAILIGVTQADGLNSSLPEEQQIFENEVDFGDFE